MAISDTFSSAFKQGPKHAPAGAGRFRPTARWRVGDWVEVRTLNEIVATLDSNSGLEGLPFMPEMIRFCGRRFPVLKSAHKTCDPTGRSNLRAMNDAVHLNTRCDGSAHDGCEASCLLFWKTAWLKRVDGPAAASDAPAYEQACLANLELASRYVEPETGRTCFRCQATQIVHATTELSSRNWRQYFEDVRTGNVSILSFVKHFGAAVTGGVASKLSRAFGLRRKSISSQSPSESSAGSPGHFCPGAVARIRRPQQIAETLTSAGTSRGLKFEDEMKGYCGGSFPVRGHVQKIIDERTGRMIRLGKDCVILNGVVCTGLSNRGRLFCPKSSFYFWRESWLDAPERGLAPEQDATPD